MESDEDPVPQDTGDILAAFRARRARQAREAVPPADPSATDGAEPNPPNPTPAEDVPGGDAAEPQAPAPSPPAPASRPAPQEPDEESQDPDESPGSDGPAGDNAAAEPTWSQAPPEPAGPDEGSADAAPPFGLLMVRGSQGTRTAGVVLLLVGTLLAVADRRLVQTGAANWFGDTSLTLLHVAALLLLAGLITYLSGWFLPVGRRPAPGLDAGSAAMAARMGRARIHVAVAWGVATLGALAMLYGVLGPAGEALVPVALGAGLVLAGVLTGQRAVATTQPLRLALAFAITQESLPAQPDAAPHDAGEPRARPASDPRVGPVLRRLDALLGSLPEDKVQAFLRSPEAKTYVALLKEHAGGDDGR